jgi:hypothetical protein
MNKDKKSSTCGPENIETARLGNDDEEGKASVPAVSNSALGYSS